MARGLKKLTSEVVTYSSTMADDNKEPFFSKEKREQALKHLDATWKNKQCECCQKKNWTLGADIVTPTVLSTGGGVVIGGPQYPAIMVICNNCGNTKFFNAVVSKIIETDNKKGEEEDA